VEEVLDEFVTKLVALAAPLWEIQASALKKQETHNDGSKKKDWRSGGQKKQFIWLEKKRSLLFDLSQRRLASPLGRTTVQIAWFLGRC
jgi:hypothetical protein